MLNIYLKIDEYIELLNNGYIPVVNESQIKFTTGEGINHFWPNQKNRIIDTLNSDPKYQVGYEKAKDTINKLKTKKPKDLKLLKQIDEYIELLNNGYLPKICDSETKFTNGEDINHFWSNQKNKIIDTLNNDSKYQVGYEQAKEIINKLTTKRPKEIQILRQIDEYIELLNNGYIPVVNENQIKFQNGEVINLFWHSHKNKIIDTLNNDPRYQTGYERAKNTIKQLSTKTSVEIKISNKVDEYIELLNCGYMPKYNDYKIKFKNGELIGKFWANHKDKVIGKLNSEPKYQVGYETAKEVINQNIVSYKLQEYIELLNNGYIPVQLDYQNKFQNGDLIGTFWLNHKDKVITALNNDPKYQIGYEKAKNTICQLATKTSVEIKTLKKVDEYIELLNCGYMPKYNDYKTKFQNGEAISRFWSNHKDKVIDKLNNDPKYQVGYETAKKAILNNTTNEPKISKDQILKYLGIIVDEKNNSSIKSIIQSVCFNNHVSNQNKQIEKAYYKALNELDKLDILDENMIIDIITNAIIENHLEKEEREEFKKAILFYLEKVKKLQKLDIAFEEDNQKRVAKIKKYQFNKFDIEECVLINLEFNQSKLIEPQNDLYNRRKLISNYIIDWNEFTTEEKEAIIKQNNFTLEEISLINEKQEEIKTLKKQIRGDNYVKHTY